MTITIALAGKGGVGKTTIAALVVEYLVQNYGGSILAIDADPSSNLNMSLGLEIEWTVGDIREDLLEKIQSTVTEQGAAMGSLPGGFTKHDYLNYQIRTSLSEGDRFDLIAMGRSEGPGCYCAVNHNLRMVIDSISKNYDFLIIDNEAGMEHLSRRTTRDVQHLLIISDPSLRGLVAAKRISELSKELEIHIENSYLIVNKAPNPLPEPVESFISDLNLPLLGVIPNSDELLEFEFTGRPIIEMGEDSILYQSVADMIAKIM